MEERFEKMQDEAVGEWYQNPEDMELRERCLNMAVNLLRNENWVTDESLFGLAERMRNYVRFGYPFTPYWCIDGTKKNQ